MVKFILLNILLNAASVFAQGVKINTNHRVPLDDSPIFYQEVSRKVEKKGQEYYLQKPSNLPGGELFNEDFVIRGRIVDSDGIGLPGVNIFIKGKNIGTTSDADGAFELRVSKTDVLVISYIGFSTDELVVEKNLNVLPFSYELGSGKVKYQATAKTMNLSIPSFQLPPPQPSADTELKVSYFKSAKYLEDVNKILSRALTKAGWGDMHYYKLIDTDKNILDGFALISQPEQIKDDGSPQEDLKRWELKLETWKEGDFWDYLKSHFRTKKGYFKVTVFIVSKTVVTPSTEKIEFEKASGWFKQGGTGLPKIIGKIPFTEDFNCTALVYEFQQIENEVKMFSRGWPTETYLEKSKLSQALNPD